VSQFAFKTPPASAVAGERKTLTVEAQDAVGNRVTSETRDVTVEVRGSVTLDGIASPQPATQLLNIATGRALFDLQSFAAETVTLRLIDSQATGLAVSTITIDIVGGRLDLLVATLVLI
jgi:hypothetical protein